MKVVVFLLSLFILVSCNEVESKNETSSVTVDNVLPILGPKDIDENGDTLFHVIPKFVFTNQDSLRVNNDWVKGKVYIASFFFTSCPYICPKVTNQMKRLQALTKDIEELQFISHTVDPKRDTLAKLRTYIEKYNIDTHNWNFLRSSKEYVYEIAKYGYKTTALEDEQADGGFIHSQFLILVDREGRIRSMHDGTVTEEVDAMEKDIRILIDAYNGEQ